MLFDIRCKQCNLHGRLRYLNDNARCSNCLGELEKVWFVANVGKALYKNFEGDMFSFNGSTFTQVI